MSDDRWFRSGTSVRRDRSLVTRTISSLRRQPLVVASVLFALFGLDVLDAVLPPASSATGLVRWLLAFGVNWLVAVVLLAVVVWGERRPLSSIGLERPAYRDLAAGIAGFVLGVATFLVTGRIVESLGLTSTASGIADVATLPVATVVAIALTAAITEEILFRGYPIERLAEITGSVWIGAGITFAVFTGAHVPFWGIGGALQIGVWTLVVTFLYVWRRNLVACMLMHVLNNLFAYVALPALTG